MSHPSESVRPSPDRPAHPNRIIYPELSLPTGAAGVRIGTGFEDGPAFYVSAGPDGSIFSLDPTGRRDYRGTHIAGIQLEGVEETVRLIPLSDAEILVGGNTLAIGISPRQSHQPWLIAAAIPTSPRPGSRIRFRLFGEVNQAGLTILSVTPHELRAFAKDHGFTENPSGSHLLRPDLVPLNKLPTATVLTEPDNPLTQMVWQYAKELATNLRRNQYSTIPAIAEVSPHHVVFLTSPNRLKKLMKAIKTGHHLRWYHRKQQIHEGMITITVQRDGIMTPLSAYILIQNVQNLGVFGIRTNRPEDLVQILEICTDLEKQRAGNNGR